MFGKVQPVGIHRGREAPVASDKEQKTARAAACRQLARDGGAIRRAIMTQNDRTPARQRHDRRRGVTVPCLIGQEPHGGQALRFELTACVC